MSLLLDQLVSCIVGVSQFGGVSNREELEVVVDAVIPEWLFGLLPLWKHH